jgi:hypothetical protein
MNQKETYYLALKKHKRKMDEISIGETLGLDEDSTMKIISQLLSEYKIEFISEGAANYRVKNK